MLAMTKRLRELEAELASRKEKSTALITFVEIESEINGYKLALENLKPVLAAARKASVEPVSVVHGITARRELREALEEMDVLTAGSFEGGAGLE